MARQQHKHWRIKQRVTVVEDQWISLQSDVCELPDGTVVQPYYVMKERDWVHILAVNAQGEVLVVRQYRHGAATVCSELPGGEVDEGESPLAAAKRELREETGFAAKQWKKVSTFFANPARQTNRVICFLAQDLTDTGRRKPDISEKITFEFVTPEEVRRLMHDGDFKQSLHVSSFLLGMEAWKGETR